MSYQGSRTRTTGAWILLEDAERFGDLLSAEWPALLWHCSQSGSDAPHTHENMSAALRCGRGRASLPLPLGGAVARADLWLDLARLRQDDIWGPHLTAGGIGTRWFVQDLSQRDQAALADSCDQVWQLFRKATKPAKVEDYAGRPLAGKRIGDAAMRRYREGDLTLELHGSVARYRLRDEPEDS